MSTDDCLGGAKSLLEMVKLLKEQCGIEVTVVNPFKNKLNDELSDLGIFNYSIGYQLNICRKDCSGIKWILKYCLKWIRYKICQQLAIRKLERLLDVSGFDIIHTNNTVEDIGAYFAKKYSIPHVWHIREFGDKDFNFYYFNRNIAKYISDNSSVVIAISNAIKSDWIKKGVSPDKIVTIVHGVNPNGIIPKEASKDVGKKRIIFAGNILPQKGQFDFIKSVNKLDVEYKRSVLVDFYGTCEENYKSEITAYINKNDLQDNVRLMGYSSELKKHLGEYDIGVVNSRCEAMGRVTIEYMMAGLCVLASNTGANIELLSDDSGVLYEYDNPDSLVNMLLYLLDDDNRIKAYGDRAKEKALNKYSIVKNVNLYIKLYESLIDRQ